MNAPSTVRGDIAFGDRRPLDGHYAVNLHTVDLCTNRAQSAARWSIGRKVVGGNRTIAVPTEKCLPQRAFCDFRDINGYYFWKNAWAPTELSAQCKTRGRANAPDRQREPRTHNTRLGATRCFLARSVPPRKTAAVGAASTPKREDRMWRRVRRVVLPAQQVVRGAHTGLRRPSRGAPVRRRATPRQR